MNKNINRFFGLYKEKSYLCGTNSLFKTIAMRNYVVLLFLILAPLLRAEPADFVAAVDSLDILLQHRAYYQRRQRNSIDSIRAAVPPTGNDRAKACKRLADGYRRLNIDSALYYYDEALKALADSNSLEYKRICWAKSSIMPVGGLLHEGRELFESLKPGVDADSSVMREYYANGVELYLYITDYYPRSVYKKKYGEIAFALNDSLLTLLPPGSDEYRMHKAFKDIYQGRNALAVGELNELLKQLTPAESMYARVHAVLASYYTGEGRREEAGYHLALAAAGDVMTANQEFTALTHLGIMLYEDGDVDRAYRYLMQALESSVAAGSRLRTLENARRLPLISQAFGERDRRRTVWLVIAMIVLSAALVTIVAMMVIMRRKQKDVNEMQLRLKDNVQLKDAYIGQVLSMCSLYIERMEEFNRLAGRKIKAGQVQDLYQMIESGKILQEQANQFYEVFDKAFFGIYPDFVDRVNELLLPDKQITLPAPGRLTPESRILAFMRLGIDDSARLSKFLGLSLNTIYTYRNKLKSRAVDRASFEAEVKKIGLIQ